MNNAEKQYTDLYSRFSGMIKENSSDVMNSVRDRAMDSFLKLGFPGKKDEKRLTGFLDDNAAIMPRVMLRYAIERLPGDLRKHYMSLKNK